MACLLFRLCDNSPEILREVCLDMGWTEYEDDEDKYDWNIWWKSSGFRSSDFEACRPWQRLNHFPKSSSITRKDCLVRNLRRMKGIYGTAVYNFVPLSFNLPNDYRKFVSEYSLQKEAGKTCFWICKPTDQSRGKGIFIFKDLSELSYDCASVVQKYIHNPMLIAGYKFDLRIYVLMTSLCPLNAYVYHEGLVRFGTEKFDLNCLDNVFSHLTNTSINKQSPWYSTDKDRIGRGCKWSIGQLRIYLHQNNIDDRLLWHKINAIIILTLLAQPTEVQENSTNCFELFGFDILIDANLKPWLLEVNFSPSLGIDSALDLAIKKPLLQDTLDIINLQDSDITASTNCTMNGNIGTRINKTRPHSQNTISQAIRQRTVKGRKVTPHGSRSRASAPPHMLEQRHFIASSQKCNPPTFDGKNSKIICKSGQKDTINHDDNDTKAGLDNTLSTDVNTNIEGDTSQMITKNMTEQSISTNSEHLAVDNAIQTRTMTSSTLSTASLEFQEALYWTKSVHDSSNVSSPSDAGNLKDPKSSAFTERLYFVQNNKSFGHPESSIIGEDESEEKHLSNPISTKKCTAHLSLSSRQRSLPLLNKALVNNNCASIRRSSQSPCLTNRRLYQLPKEINTRQLSLMNWKDKYGNKKQAFSKMKLCSRVGNYVLIFPFNDASQKCCSSKKISSKSAIDEVKKAIHKAIEIAKATPSTIISDVEKPLDLNKPYWGFSSIFEYSVGIS